MFGVGKKALNRPISCYSINNIINSGNTCTQLQDYIKMRPRLFYKN